MKAKEFHIGKGKYAVVCTYINHNDATEDDDQTTIRTHDKPRDNFLRDLAQLAVTARDYFKYGDLDIKVSSVWFSENNNGRFVRISFTLGSGPSVTKINPPGVNRKQFVKPGEDQPDPESLLNIFLESVDLIENRISEYLEGDREQPELPLQQEPVPEPKQKGLFGIFRK